ncbi:MAG: ribonuclease III [Lachnospiraceae bacterium]|nr:ribonuclease III [Lachnospiraceae bacterium]
MNKIGYSFKRPELLKLALTHSSYANEKHLKSGYNERIEFLGDAVLELVTSEFLYTNYPKMPEGEMTKTRASIVCEPTLALCAAELSLGDYLYLGHGEEMSGGRRRASIVSDAMEALIGAIFLDGGMEEAKRFIYRFVLTDLENKKLFTDSKTILQEIVQSNHNNKELSYVIISEDGPDHNKTYTVAALINGVEEGRGCGRTKKAAEQAAAYKAILKLQKRG